MLVLGCRASSVLIGEFLMRKRLVLAVLLRIIVSAPAFALVPRTVLAEMCSTTW